MDGPFVRYLSKINKKGNHLYLLKRYFCKYDAKSHIKERNYQLIEK